MIGQYFSHVASDGFLLVCALVMLALSAVDCFTLFAKRFGFAKVRHLSFATTIVSVGLFATFVGVLVGLYGFDSTNISASVPKLLEGLRFAFAGSVLGMGLSLSLSIAHKLFGEAAEDGDVLHSIDRKMSAMVATVQSPAELVKQFSEMKGFLKEHLTKINVSLDEALNQLARGATQEVIEALEKIIGEFNSNLTTQFGDNFKQLNAACLKLIEWQKDYTIHIETTEKNLQVLMRSLDQSATAATELTKSNEKTQRVCAEVGALMRSYDIQVKTLEAHLSNCKALGEQAGKFLTTTQTALTKSAENMTSFSGVIEASVGKQSETLAKLTREIDQQLPKTLGELEKVLTAITNQFAADYRSLFQFVTNKR